MHEQATEHQLEHASTGQGMARCIAVRPTKQAEAINPLTPDLTDSIYAKITSSSASFAAIANESDEEESETEGPELETKSSEQSQNDVLRQLHEERMQRATAKAAADQHPVQPPQSKAAAKKRTKKGKAAVSEELDEDAMLAAAINANQQAAEKTKYRIGSQAFPNPEKVRARDVLSAKISSQETNRLTKAAAEVKEIGRAHV